MTHTEHLAEAERLYSELAVRNEELEQSVSALTDTVVAQGQEIAALKTQISALEAEIVRLKKIIADMQPAEYLWKDEFAEAPDPDEYIRACDDPSKNFILAAPGKLRCVFVAGKKDMNGKAILRSELIPRKPGTNDGRDDPIGSHRRYEYSFTIPAAYNPGVSSKPNEKRNLWQMHQVSGAAPPLALELIKPDGAPWNGQQNILRLVVLGVVKWWVPAPLGQRVDFSCRAKWSTGNDGVIETDLNGTKTTIVGPNAHVSTVSTNLTNHVGLYLPASADDPAGGATEIEIHRLAVVKLA